MSKSSKNGLVSVPRFDLPGGVAGHFRQGAEKLGNRVGAGGKRGPAFSNHGSFLIGLARLSLFLEDSGF